MLIGGNTESGRIDLIAASARRCAIADGLRRANAAYCPPTNIPNVTTLSQGAYLDGKVANYINASATSNIYLNSGAVPESTRISRLTTAVPRFSEYIRFNPLPACPPLPPLATNAGQPQPSLNSCLPNKNATYTT